MLSRRELIGKGAVGAAATALALGAVTAVASPSHRDGRTAPGDSAVPSHDRDGRETPPSPAESAASSPPPWELVSPLAAGAVLAHGWRLADLGPVRDGACVITLQNARGRARRIHLCRNDG